MEIRKEKELEDILNFIKDTWRLSIIEEDILESFLYCFLGGEKEVLEKIEHLLNEETEELLLLLNDGEIAKYAEDYLDMVGEDDIEDEKTIDEFDDDELLDECDRRGLNSDDNLNIVLESQLEELKNLFLNLSFAEQNNLIEKLKNGK